MVALDTSSNPGNSSGGSQRETIHDITKEVTPQLPCTVMQKEKKTRHISMLPLLSEDSEVQFVSPELATQHLTS